jgi:hypothetical protein
VRLFGQVAVYLRGTLDAAIERLHNRADVEPEAPRRKRRRKTKLAPIFEDNMTADLETAPVMPASVEAPSQPARIVVTEQGVK